MSGSFRYHGRNCDNKSNNGKKINWSNCNGDGSLENISVQDLLSGKQLEFVTAALLLTGKLKVDAVQLFRGSSFITVTLVGNYKVKNKSNPLAEFLDQNGDIAVDDIFEALRNNVNKG